MRFIYLGLLITVINCDTKDRKKSTELHKKGIDYYYKSVSNFSYSDHDDKNVFADSCLYFISEAIRIDSSNKSAYWNKLGFEFSLKRFEEAKTTAWLYYKKFDDPHGLMKLGAVYYQLNDSVKSKKYFKQALDFYDSGIKSGNSWKTQY